MIWGQPIYWYWFAGGVLISVFEIFLPGVAKDAVEINVDQGELVVTGSRAWKAPWRE